MPTSNERKMLSSNEALEELKTHIAVLRMKGYDLYLDTFAIKILMENAYLLLCQN